jgi:general secretion pathway protein B
MSYILDALRRADSERERGSVPSIHAQPVPIASTPEQQPASRSPWPWIVLGVAAGLALPLVSYLFGSDAPVETGASGTSASSSTAPSVPVAAPAPAQPATPTPAPALASADGTSESPRAAPPEPRSAAAAPVRRSAATAPVRRTQPTAVAAAPAAPAAARTASNAGPSADAVAAAEPQGRVYARNELPAEVQRELPALAIGGSVYSESPADRLVIINGRLFKEGDQLAPSLLLEQIQLKGAVLRFKGYRYLVSY